MQGFSSGCEIPDSVMRYSRLFLVRFVEASVKGAAHATVVARRLVAVRRPRTSHRRCRRLVKRRHRRRTVQRRPASPVVTAPAARGQHHAMVAVVHRRRVGRSGGSSKASVDRASFYSSLGGEGVGLLLCFDNVLLVANALVAEPV